MLCHPVSVRYQGGVSIAKDTGNYTPTGRTFDTFATGIIAASVTVVNVPTAAVPVFDFAVASTTAVSNDDTAVSAKAVSVSVAVVVAVVVAVLQSIQTCSRQIRIINI